MYECKVYFDAFHLICLVFDFAHDYVILCLLAIDAIKKIWNKTWNKIWNKTLFVAIVTYLGNIKVNADNIPFGAYVTSPSIG